MSVCLSVGIVLCLSYCQCITFISGDVPLHVCLLVNMMSWHILCICLCLVCHKSDTVLYYTTYTTLQCMPVGSVAYLQYCLGTFFVVYFGLLHYRHEGQLFQLLQDRESCTLLRQLLAVAFTLWGELTHRHTGQEAFHVRWAALLQHLGKEHDGKVSAMHSSTR